MSNRKVSADELIERFQIENLDALYDEYLKNSGIQAAKKFNIPYEGYIKKILEEKGYDLSKRDPKKAAQANRISDKNLNLDDLYEAYLHNSLSFVAQTFRISTSMVIDLLTTWGYDLSKRDPLDKLHNKNGYAVDELVEKYKIDVPELYHTYMTNGKQFTAKTFGLSNWHLVERILEAYGYDFTGRNSKEINATKTQKSLLKKYGVEHALQIPESKEKLKATSRSKYGYDFYIASPEFKEKSKNTNLEKYGYEWSTQCPEVKLKHDAANYLKYGVKDAKQVTASDKLKKYLNDKALSINLLIENKFTYADLRQYFPQDSETQLYSWMHRFNLYDYLEHESRSLPERELADLLFNLGFTEFNNRKLLGNGQEIDIYNPELKIGVEFNGLYYHSSAVLSDKNYHLNKSKLAEKNGIRLIHVYENEWIDPDIKKKIISLLKIASGKVDKKIFARKCEIREITNAEARSFNEANHLQGHRNAQVTYGLFYDNQLVQLMSFSKTRYNRNLKGNNDWEIIRGCPGSNNIVVGGVSKLFNHFIKEKNPDHVFSYCDFNKFNGVGYEAIGMKFVGYTGPDKKWVIGYEVVNRNPYKYHELKKKATACLWGAGSKKYLWENPNIL